MTIQTHWNYFCITLKPIFFEQMRNYCIPTNLGYFKNNFFSGKKLPKPQRFHTPPEKNSTYRTNFKSIIYCSQFVQVRNSKILKRTLFWKNAWIQRTKMVSFLMHVSISKLSTKTLIICPNRAIKKYLNSVVLKQWISRNPLELAEYIKGPLLSKI